MRDVAIVAFAQSPSVRADSGRSEVEMLAPVIAEAIARSGISRRDIGFTCSGSCDYIAGVPFSFVQALDAVGAWPPIRESHVEMDGAWGLYEAWVRLQIGDIDSALVYGFGKSSAGDPRDVSVAQLDPYYLAPLWPDSVSVAALQARALLESNGNTERHLAEVVARNLRNAVTNSNAQVKGDFDPDELLEAPYEASPLRAHDCPPISDGAAAVVLAAGDLARRVCERPAWVTGIDHRIEAHSLGARDLVESPSAALAAEMAGVAKGPIEVAELHAPFSHQELILREAMGLGKGVDINPSGGALAANPIMATGLIRIGEAASHIMDGSARRTLGHATSGPCLQQNLVCVMEAR
ncbi:MAG TPA: thiolase domain-containing protein [Dehalococcoidia bacterium]|nr:thiolase domain-containing protein [Dehalococcoidia bacterium]